MKINRVGLIYLYRTNWIMSVGVFPVVCVCYSSPETNFMRIFADEIVEVHQEFQHLSALKYLLLSP